MSNLWAIGQQYADQLYDRPAEHPDVRPPAERRVKRVGGGKTEAASREDATRTARSATWYEL